MNLERFVNTITLQTAELINKFDGLMIAPSSPSKPGVMEMRAKTTFVPMMNLDPGGSFSLLTLAKVIKGGSKVIELKPEIARVLAHVDLNLEIGDYAQPFEAVGVIIPAIALGRKTDLLACCYWRPEIGFVMGTFQGSEDYYYFNIGLGLEKTIEECFLGNGIRGMELSDSEQDELLQVARIAMNSCLFAMERGVRPIRMNRQERQRKRAKRRAAEHPARIFEIQHLDMLLRDSSTGNSNPKPVSVDGTKQRMHRRRGHWKMQAFGPGRSHRKRLFIHSYMVNIDDDRDIDTVIS
jgi:hypothetical protein